MPKENFKKICPKCYDEFDALSNWGDERKFCSRHCANGREQSEETNKKRSASYKKYWGSLTEEDKNNHNEKRNQKQLKYWDLLTEDERLKLKSSFFGYRSKLTEEEKEKRLFLVEFDDLGFDRKRKRVIIEQDNKCNNCGIDKWLEQHITLELEHKDGNRHNNDRDNLEAICPNCHSLTDTWRGRNKGVSSTHRKKVTDEQLFNAIVNTTSTRQALIKVGLAPKGNNYKRANLIKNKFMDPET